MKPLIFNLFDNHPLAEKISKKLNIKIGELVLKNFPDHETYIKINENVENRDIIIIDSLNNPNQKILPLIFAVETLKEMGAGQVGLVSPYLSYMRQDARFHPGEGITSVYFARLISFYFNWMITVDPHLHRRYSLNEIYNIKNLVVSSSMQISKWIRQNVQKPFLIGPDIESKQWISEIAKAADIPFVILRKIRKGDRDVEISIPDVDNFRGLNPVLIDDIISTGRTFIETIKKLKHEEMSPPICIGVHAVFANNAYDQIKGAGVKQIVTCNSIEHPSNEIDLSLPVVEGIKEFLSYRAEK